MKPKFDIEHWSYYYSLYGFGAYFILIFILESGLELAV